jgi:hypothetical protein
VVCRYDECPASRRAVTDTGPALVDGDANTICRSSQHSTRPWVRVDLHEERAVKRVAIQARYEIVHELAFELVETFLRVAQANHYDIRESA